MQMHCGGIRRSRVHMVALMCWPRVQLRHQSSTPPSSFGSFFASRLQKDGVTDATQIQTPTANLSEVRGSLLNPRRRRHGGRGGSGGGGREDEDDEADVFMPPPAMSAPPSSLSAAASMQPRRRRLVSTSSANFGGNATDALDDGGDEGPSHEGAATRVIHVDRHLNPMYMCDGDHRDIPADEFAHLSYRRGESPETNLSIDVPFKKLRDAFNDYDARRCLLCNESIQMWSSHCSFVPHAGREAIMLELLRPYSGTPEEVLRTWWFRLHNSKQFRRIKALSDDNPKVRKRKIQYLLRFLRERHVLRECFDVFKTTAPGQVAAGRSWEFERLEWVGDNVVKYVFNNRMGVVFPLHEGGVKQKLGFVQSLIDGNDGLARAYDYLDLHLLTQSDRVVSKFKSDVVEAMFGELQVYLWSTELDEGVETRQYPISIEFVPLRQLVWHVMEELAHCIFMFHAEYICQKLMKALKHIDARFVKANPALRADSALRSSSIAAMYAKRDHYRFKPMAEKTQRAHTLALTLHHMVTPLGGFISEGSSAQSSGVRFKAVDHSYLPQLQLLPSPKHESKLRELQHEKQQMWSALPEARGMALSATLSRDQPRAQLTIEQLNVLAQVLIEQPQLEQQEVLAN